MKNYFFSRVKSGFINIINLSTVRCIFHRFCSEHEIEVETHVDGSDNRVLYQVLTVQDNENDIVIKYAFIFHRDVR